MRRGGCLLVQGKIGRIKLLNALSDAIIDLKVALYEAEGTKLKYKPVATDRRPAFDGGEGSGNFGHSGRPGQVGGSSPSGSATTSKKLYDGVKSEKIKGILEERRKSRYTTFGKTDAEVKEQNDELVRELKKEGAEITNIEDDAHFEPVYHVFHPGMSYQEVGIAERALNNGMNVGSSREDYIAKCKKAGVKPMFHEVPDEVPVQFLKKTDGTPVYADLSEESQLTDEEIVKYSGNQEKLRAAADKAVSSWNDNEASAVRAYTSEYGANNYRGINAYLATGERANDETEKAADAITKALDHEVGADCLLFRGVDDFSRETGLESNDKMLRKIVRGDYSTASKLRDALVGQEVTNKHIASTSLRRDVTTYGQRPVQILFKTPAKAKGVNISQASVYGGGASKQVQALAVAMGKSITQEDEVAFKPGMRYRIDAVDFSLDTTGKKNRGQVFITATVLTDTSANDSAIKRPTMSGIRATLDSVRSLSIDGGPGSGNFGHAGRPGKVGGSVAEGSGGSGGRHTKENSAPSGHSPSEKARAAKIKEYTGEKDEAKVRKMDEAIRGLTNAYQMDKEKTGLVEEFIRKSPKYDGGVYRGIPCTDEEYESIMSGIKDGATIRASDKDRATSWSSDPAVAAKYSKEKSEWMNSVTFKCEKNESGVPVAYLSAHPSESEVFLSKDATWEVVKVEESTVGDAKKAVVHLKEKPLPKSSETESGQAENKIGT